MKAIIFLFVGLLFSFASPFSTSASSVLTNGPLRVSSVNGRYFTDGLGKTILLSGSHTWLNQVDGGYVDPPPSWDYLGYLNFLQTYNHNFFRLWTWETSKWSTETTLPYWYSPPMYQRTGPGLDLDNKPKFDLTLFNQEYFDRMRSRIVEAGNRGVYVSVMFFNGWGIAKKYSGLPGDYPWKGHPYNINNNINNINGDPNSDNNGLESHTLAIPAITTLQEAYIRKVVDTVNDLDNVLYEISNESDGSSTAWQYHLIDYLKQYESTKPKQHPVGMTVEWPDGDNQKLFNSHADWVSLNGDINEPPVATGAKVIIADTDHICGLCGDRKWVWKSLTRGENPIWMDNYDGALPVWYNPGNLLNDLASISLRQNMGYVLSYANKMDLSAMTPQGSLSSTNYVLANTGTNSEYLAYAQSGGPFYLNLVGNFSLFDYEWFNPASGVVAGSGVVLGGTNKVFTPPFSGDAVLYLKAQTTTSTPTPTTQPTSAPTSTPTPTVQPTSIPTSIPTSLPTPTPTPISTGLIASYNFNEGSGKIINDRSGNGNNGNVGSPSWTTSGKYGKALVFGTLARRVIVPDKNILDLTNSMTLEAWIYPTSNAGWETVVLKENAPGNLAYSLYLNGSDRLAHSYIFSNQVEVGIAGSGTILLKVWTHLAVTYDGQTIKIYKNGLLTGTKNYTGNITTTTGPLVIGGNSIWTNENFPGRIDEVRIYNQPRTQLQIQADMNTPI